MNINDSFKERKMVKLYATDKAFSMNSGLTVYRRAFIDIMPECPSEVSYLIYEAINRGWIKLGAYAPEEQIAWEKLRGISS